ncbi:hypothetical protein [Pseudoalteromonas sp. C8]|uniref:hypothetical protein n=1 Tax=Pseudoalteromonas sp. C8 TaxID=2686345 RepID=UPI0013FE1CEA|nr:hypothetical protein [Pseudoalteromonas sp. C8]
MEEQQNAQAEIMRLKARVLDSLDEAKGLSEVLGTIAKRVGFEGQSLAELVETVPVIQVETNAE